MPLAQLLPDLHERLHLPRTRQPAIDHPAIPLRRLIKISHRSQAEMCEVVAQLLEILLAQNLHLLAIRTPGHGVNNASIFAVCSPASKRALPAPLRRVPKLLGDRCRFRIYKNVMVTGKWCATMCDIPLPSSFVTCGGLR